MSPQDTAADIQVPATPSPSSVDGASKKRSASEAAHSFESPSKLSKHATPHTSPSQSGSSSKKRPGSRKKGPIRLNFASGTFSGQESNESGLRSAESSPSQDHKTSSPAVVGSPARRLRSSVSAATPLVSQPLPGLRKTLRKPKRTTEGSASEESSPILSASPVREHQTSDATETSQDQHHGTSFPTAASIAASQQPEKSLVKSNLLPRVSNSAGSAEKLPIQLYETSSLLGSQQPETSPRTSTSIGGAEKSLVQLHGTPSLAVSQQPKELPGLSTSTGGAEKSLVQLHGTSSLAVSQQPKELPGSSTSTGGAEKSLVQLHGTSSLAPVAFATSRSVFTFAKSGRSCSISQLKTTPDICATTLGKPYADYTEEVKVADSAVFIRHPRDCAPEIAMTIFDLALDIAIAIKQDPDPDSKVPNPKSKVPFNDQFA
jgi:hypothetical protein